MNKIEQKKEYVIGEALRLFEDGKSQSFILDLYPQYKEDLSELFKTINIIDSQSNIKVPESLLKSVLAKIPTSSLSTPTPSPFDNIHSFYNLKRLGAFSTLALLLFVGGGFIYNRHNINTNISNSQIADTALNKDIASVDSELGNLDADAASIDNSLDNQSPGTI